MVPRRDAATMAELSSKRRHEGVRFFVRCCWITTFAVGLGTCAWTYSQSYYYHSWAEIQQTFPFSEQLLQMKTSPTSLIALGKEKSKDLCDSTRSTMIRHQDYFDEDEWQLLQQQNRDFHRRGGSLQSVQRFKDESIDSTTKALGLTFVDQNQQRHEQPSQYLRKYFAEHHDPRGGYGKPLPGKWDNDATSKALMDKRWFDVIEPTDGRKRWDAGLGPIGPKCSNLLQLGDTNGDGYKFYCAPKATPSKGVTSVSSGASSLDTGNSTCHVLSVGGNDNWKFEIAVRKQLGCTTHTFDCTLPGGKPRRKPDDPSIRFYNYCVDGISRTDEHGRSYLSYPDMLQKAEISSPPSYFKIDVEGFEYDIFHQMILQSPELLPTQIQVELHWATRMTGIPWMMRTRTSAEIALFSSMMYHAGYLPVVLDFNPYCSSCMEVLYFRASQSC